MTDPESPLLAKAGPSEKLLDVANRRIADLEARLARAELERDTLAAGQHPSVVAYTDDCDSEEVVKQLRLLRDHMDAGFAALNIRLEGDD